MDRRIKFRHLDAFSAIVRAKSLKKAAEALHLTQPAISKALRELEDIIGVTLLERSRSGVRLTPEGEVFLQFAEQSTAALQHGLRSIRATAAGAAPGSLKLGALPSVMPHLVPRAVRAFRRAAPDTIVQILEAPHMDLTNRLRSGDLDLVVGRLGRPKSMEGLTFSQLYNEEVVVVTSPASPHIGVTRLADLADCLIIYPPQHAAIRPLVARHMITEGQPLFANRIESSSAVFGRAMVRMTPEAVWFISAGVVADDLADGTLVKLAIPMERTDGAIGIISRMHEIPSNAARTFSRLLAQAARR